jgi:hypothetical protein
MWCYADTLCSWQYELLDEIMDFGYPQYTEAKILSEFIKTDAYRMEVTQRPPMAVTNAVSWRSEGVQYKKNEVGFGKKEKGFFVLFIDVVSLWMIFLSSCLSGFLGCGGEC